MKEQTNERIMLKSDFAKPQFSETSHFEDCKSWFI